MDLNCWFVQGGRGSEYVQYTCWFLIHLVSTSHCHSTLFDGQMWSIVPSLAAPYADTTVVMMMMMKEKEFSIIALKKKHEAKVRQNNWRQVNITSLEHDRPHCTKLLRGDARWRLSSLANFYRGFRWNLHSWAWCLIRFSTSFEQKQRNLFQQTTTKMSLNTSVSFCWWLDGNAYHFVSLVSKR